MIRRGEYGDMVIEAIDRGLQCRLRHCQVRSGPTLATGVRFLRSYATYMGAADNVWNRATEAWEPSERAGFGPGDLALTGLLAFHSVAMNGGVLHALEMADDHMLQEAVEGYRYFGFDGVAALIESGNVRSKGVENLAPSDAEELERELDRAYSERIPSDQTLGDALERHFGAHPDQYAP